MGFAFVVNGLNLRALFGFAVIVCVLLRFVV